MSKEENTSDIKNIVSKLTDFSEKELNTLTQAIDRQTRERAVEESRALVAKHDNLVGKCFKTRKTNNDMWKYYKIISSRATNEHWVSALAFDECPTYYFDFHLSKMIDVRNGYFGHYVCEGIYITEMFVKSLNNLFYEISLEEYNAAMTEYINRLQAMKWPVNPHRSRGE